METVNTTNQSDFYYHNINSNVDAILPLYGLILLVCIVGNAVVCMTILCNPEMRKCRWYILLINLSFSDVGFALTSLSHILQLKGVNTGKQRSLLLILQ